VSAPITTSDPTPRSALEFVHLTPVDGLRAVAAILVVLFHADMPGFGNGFVGVDVFFVLSGFLITSLLLRERLRTDSISLWGFYARRARRLFPAALLVLIATAVLYQLWASPLEVATNRSGFSFASIYVSNWYFMGQATDYFAQDSAVSPVLHYWSLSVEEQFYLVWPIVMLGVLSIRSIRERLNIPFLISLFIALFVISAVMNSGNETSAYFNTIARAYQLIAGATLAAIMLKWNQLGRPTNALTRLAPLVGAGSLILLLLVSTSLTGLGPWHVGVVGVIATVGILWGISTAENSRVFTPLTTRSARSLGNWSYSIYLWHWPVIVLGGLIGIIPEFWGYRVPLVLVLTIGLAAATYHFLEKPVLSISVTTAHARKAAVGIGLVATIGAALLSLAILRVPAASANLINTAAQGQQESDGPTADVLIDSSGGGKTVLVVGDSHANFWRQGFTAYAQEKGFTVVFVTKLSCPWMDIPALAPQSQDTLFDCQERLWDPAIEAAKEFTPAVTVLASRSVLSRDLLVDGKTISADQPGWADVVAAGTQKALAQIAPFTNKIVIIEPMPETTTSMLDCLSTGANPASCDQAVDVKTGTQEFEAITRAIAANNPNVLSVSLDDLICPDDVCPAEVNGIATHRDNQHLTWDYAEAIMPQVDALFAKQGAPLS
jgi:peptidoglycan/LPS O-acetylase OafA/YrhL